MPPLATHAPGELLSEKAPKRIRRGVADKAGRLMARKLGRVPETISKNRVNDVGQSIGDVLAEEVVERYTLGGRAASCFWMKLWKDIDLGGAIVEQVPPFDSDLPVGPELGGVIDAAHAEKPADRQNMAFGQLARG